jgi:hypothetical protein
MATSFNKTYSIEIKYNYSDSRTILATDMNVEVLRAKVIKRIGEEVGHIQQGDLNANIVGSVSEA